MRRGLVGVGKSGRRTRGWLLRTAVGSAGGPHPRPERGWSWDRSYFVLAGSPQTKDRSSKVETFEASWSQEVVEVARKRVRQYFEARKKQDPKAKLELLCWESMQDVCMYGSDGEGWNTQSRL